MGSCGIKTEKETSWCPGCGDIAILEALRRALEALGKEPHEVLVVGGIGQAAKTAQYINTNGFCGLHGRALPPAVAAKISNKDLTVIVNSGEGDTYGEGGNHFLHNVRRNVDIAHFVHDNQIYGLTKGQASPTSDEGSVTELQPMGSFNTPLRPLMVALTLGAGFVARAFSGDIEHLTAIMIEAIQFKGYALVDILQPCVSFNKVNNYQWYSKRIYKLGEEYDYTDRRAAMDKAEEWGEKIPVGIIYKKESPTFIDKVPFLRNEPLVDKVHDLGMIKSFMDDYR